MRDEMLVGAAKEVYAGRVVTGSRIVTAWNSLSSGPGRCRWISFAQDGGELDLGGPIRKGFAAV